MYRNEVSGCIICESVDDMIKLGIQQMYEDKDNYYVLTKKENRYDNGMYKVNKKTEEVSFLMYPMFISTIEENTRPVNISKFIIHRRKKKV